MTVVGAHEIFQEGWFCQNPDGLTRHWSSWWGCAPGIYLLLRLPICLVLVPEVRIVLSQAVVSRREGHQFMMVPTTSSFGFISVRWPWGRRKPRHLEFAHYMPWGNACLGSTFRGLDFWAVSHLFIVIFSPAESGCVRLGARHPSCYEGGEGIIVLGV